MSKLHPSQRVQILVLLERQSSTELRRIECRYYDVSRYRNSLEREGLIKGFLVESIVPHDIRG